MVLATFFDLVQETSSARLMDSSNWNHNDKKGLFFFFLLFNRWVFLGEATVINGCLQTEEWALLRYIRHKVTIMTGFSQDKSYFHCVSNTVVDEKAAVDWTRF